MDLVIRFRGVDGPNIVDNIVDDVRVMGAIVAVIDASPTITAGFNRRDIMDVVPYDLDMGGEIQDSNPSIPRDVESLDIDIVALIGPRQIAPGRLNMSTPVIIRDEPNAMGCFPAGPGDDRGTVLARSDMHCVAGRDRIGGVLDGCPGVSS